MGSTYVKRRVSVEMVQSATVCFWVGVRLAARGRELPFNPTAIRNDSFLELWTSAPDPELPVEVRCTTVRNAAIPATGPGWTYFSTRPEAAFEFFFSKADALALPVMSESGRQSIQDFMPMSVEAEMPFARQFE